MHRLSIYLIELPKNEFSTTFVSMTLWWRETEDDGDGDGHTISSKGR